MRRSEEEFTTLSRNLQATKHQTPDDRYATFADLLTAGSRKANTYTNPQYGPICEALFAANSPYRTSSNNRSEINIFEVRADPKPAPLFSPSSPSPSEQPPPEDVHAFLTATASGTLNRAIARTTQGHLALVDALIPRAEPGDVVCLLIGCDVPVVLRPRPGPRSRLDIKGARTTHGVFEFVGEAYVQGFMHGEAVKRAEELARGGEKYAGDILLV